MASEGAELCTDPHEKLLRVTTVQQTSIHPPLRCCHSEYNNASKLTKQYVCFYFLFSELSGACVGRECTGVPALPFHDIGSFAARTVFITRPPPSVSTYSDSFWTSRPPPIPSAARLLESVSSSRITFAREVFGQPCPVARFTAALPILRFPAGNFIQQLWRPCEKALYAASSPLLYTL